MSVIYRVPFNFLLKRLLQIALHATFILIAACYTATTYADSSKQTKLDSKVINGFESGQYVILLRHALAPGFGDPNYFDVNDCSTQRNLSELGRQQAQSIGRLLRANGIKQAAVYSSQWCRCLETAHLLGVGEVFEQPIINSFYQRTERKAQQTRDLKKWLINNNPVDNNKSKWPIILVTHQVNITALTEVFPSSGELVFIDIDESENVSVVFQLETSNEQH